MKICKPKSYTADPDRVFINQYYEEAISYNPDIQSFPRTAFGKPMAAGGVPDCRGGFGEKCECESGLRGKSKYFELSSTFTEIYTFTPVSVTSH